MLTRLSFLLRIALDIVLAIAVVQGWWQAVALFVLAGLVLWGNYFEALIAGLAYDAIFHPALSSGLSQHIAALAAAVGFALAAIFRSSFRRRI